MTLEEFENKFRGQMLLFVTEAWAVRKLPPSELGMAVDASHIRMAEIMRRMYATLHQPKGNK